MSPLTIKIDPSVCIAAAACVATDPTLFALDEDNVAVVLSPDGTTHHEFMLEVSAEQKRRIMEASQSCPTGAITVITVKE